MVEFNKQIEEERKNDPKPEEGKELTDKQKEEIALKRNEESIRKIREFDKHMKEAPKFIFNSNVFKNVKFAISEEEVKKDEELV